MKPGANIHDVKEIMAMYAEGKSAEEISEELRIEFECVKSFEAEAEKPEVEKATKKPVQKSEVKDPVAAALAAAASGDKE